MEIVPVDEQIVRCKYCNRDVNNILIHIKNYHPTEYERLMRVVREYKEVEATNEPD